MSRTVIVGAGIAGVRTAESLRSAGYDGSITLLGEESELPYDRPPLSKGLLAGSAGDDTLRLLTEEQAETLEVRLLLGHRAERLDLEAGQVERTGADPLPYDTLVIATGSRARRSPWGERPGLHLLRTLDDARRLRADLDSGGPLVVVGAGFIGAEVAATARSLGLDVTLVDPLPTPMNQSLPTELGELFADLHRRHGVRAALGVGVAGIEGERGAFSVRLENERALPAASVVIGIGALPNDDWVRGSGLAVDNGVVCDQYCRAINHPSVFAVGDVARWRHPNHGSAIRVEHWTNAVEQAACVAHNITEPDDLRAYAPVEYVWSDQYDWRLQVMGRPSVAERPLMLRDRAVEARAAALHSEDGDTLCGAAIVNWPRALVACRKALASGHSAIGEIREAIIG